TTERNEPSFMMTIPSRISAICRVFWVLLGLLGAAGRTVTPDCWLLGAPRPPDAACAPGATDAPATGWFGELGSIPSVGYPPKYQVSAALQRLRRLADA